MTAASSFMFQAQAWLPTIGYVVLAGLVGLLWGLGELVGAFTNETGRSLRTSGAWLLLLLNFTAAALSYALLIAIISGANSWLTAVGVGIAWPTVIRNTTLKLVQPFQPDATEDKLTLRFEEAYAAIQTLAKQLINASLVRQRMKLLSHTIELDLHALEKQVRLTIIASPIQPDTGQDSAEQFVNRIMQRNDDEDIKKALLGAFLLQYYDRATLEDVVKEQRISPHNQKDHNA